MRLNIDVPGECLDLAAHNVHTNTAARDVRDLLRRREARQEDQANGICIVEAVRLTLRNHPLLNRLTADLVCINARTVVRDHDDNVVALVACDESDLAGARLSLRLACIGALNAVVKRVAQKMHDRITDLIDNRTVQLRLLTFDCEVDVLAEFL